MESRRASQMSGTNCPYIEMQRDIYFRTISARVFLILLSLLKRSHTSSRLSARLAQYIYIYT